MGTMDAGMGRNQPKMAMDRMISTSDTNEIFNVVSHGLGALSAIVATMVLVTLAAQAGTWAHVVGFAVYGTTLFLSLLASALLHGFLFVGRYQRVLRATSKSIEHILLVRRQTSRTPRWTNHSIAPCSMRLRTCPTRARHAGSATHGSTCCLLLLLA
jgi:hypothetical protein